MKLRFTLFVFLLVLAAAKGQEVISIATQNTQMLLSVDKEKNLKYDYFGKKAGCSG